MGSSVQELRAVGLVPAAEMAEELRSAARGLPLCAKDGTIRAFAMVDAEDFGWLSKWRWSLHDGRAVRNHKRGGKSHLIRLHRQIINLGFGDPRQVDHINRDPLDNRRENLRIARHAENRQNNGCYRTEGRTSKYRGVSWDPKRGKWRAQATLNYRNHFIGRFDTEQEAADAAAAWREQHMPFSTE